MKGLLSNLSKVRASHRILFSILSVALSVLLVAGTVFAVISISNILSFPDVIVVDDGGTGGGGGSTQPTNLPLVLSTTFSTPQTIDVNDFFYFDVTLANPSPAGAPGYGNVRVKFDITKDSTTIADTDVLLWYTLDGGTTWLTLPMVIVDSKLEGWFGPTAGFPVPSGYNATTPLRAQFVTTGTYKATAEAVPVP